MLKLKKVTEDDVDIRIECLEEDIDPMEQFDDPIIARDIKQKYDEGNDWAWCCVKVTVFHAEEATFKSTQYLGGCSYENEEDFKKDLYYKGMVNEALGNIQRDMEEVFAFLCSKVQNAD